MSVIEPFFSSADELKNPPLIITAVGTHNNKLSRIASVDTRNLPESYLSNSVKEEIVLEYARHFQDQFCQLYPTRPPLLLLPENEAGTTKFICSTLRPSHVSVKELYDASHLSKFLAEYITYEPLDPPDQLPSIVPSPLFTLQTRVGDCVDLSVLLCSFLLGNGYDAYVVIGTAPEWMTLKHQDKDFAPTFKPPEDAVNRSTHLDNINFASNAPATRKLPVSSKYSRPTLLQSESEVLRQREQKLAPPKEITELPATPSFEDGPNGETAKLSLIASRTGNPEFIDLMPLKDKYLAMAAGCIDGSLGPFAKVNVDIPDPATLPPNSKKDAELGPELQDMGNLNSHVSENEAYRVHAWVLIRPGKRGVKQAYYIEPSTGIEYPTDSSPYLSIESVFNDKNFWVNMQGQSLLPRYLLQAVDVDSDQKNIRGTLIEALRVAVETSKPPSITGKGGVLAATSFVGTLDSPQGDAVRDNIAAKNKKGQSIRPELLSPFVTALEYMKAANTIVPNVSPNLNIPAGAPVLGEAAINFVAKNISMDGSGRQTPSGGARNHPMAGLSDRGASAGSVQFEKLSSLGNPVESPRTVTTPRPGSNLSANRPPSVQSLRGGLKRICWSTLLPAHMRAMKEEIVSTVEATQVHKFEVKNVDWNLMNSDNWEYVMIPMDEFDVDDIDMEVDGTKEQKVATVDAATVEDPSTYSPTGTKPRSERANSATSATQADHAPKDQERILDLPAPWSPKLTLNPHVFRMHSLGPRGSYTVYHFRTKIEKFILRANSMGLTYRYTEYADDDWLIPIKIIEVFQQRKDGLYKRVRHILEGNTEEHYTPGRSSGLALVFHLGGTHREVYFYPNSRVDGLLLRREHLGRKVKEYYKPTLTNRMWYRSVNFIEPPRKKRQSNELSFSGLDSSYDQHGLSTYSMELEDSDSLGAGDGGEELCLYSSRLAAPQYGGPAPAASVSFSRQSTLKGTTTTKFGQNARHNTAGMRDIPLFLEASMGIELQVAKMTEKYLRNPAVPYHEDVRKIVYQLLQGSIRVDYHPGADRLTYCSRLYSKPYGEIKLLSHDPKAPEPIPYGADLFYHALLGRETECHAALKRQAHYLNEVIHGAAWEIDTPILEKTLFEVASQRVREGRLIDDDVDDTEGKYHFSTIRNLVPNYIHFFTHFPLYYSLADDFSRSADYLLPYLIAANAADVDFPTEKEARIADRECRNAYRSRLLERAHALHRRLEEENEKLLRRQQLFARSRDHGDEATEEFEADVNEAMFRISILEKRLAETEASIPKRMALLDAKLSSDPRLYCIYDVKSYQERLAANGHA